MGVWRCLEHVARDPDFYKRSGSEDCLDGGFEGFSREVSVGWLAQEGWRRAPRTHRK